MTGAHFVRAGEGARVAFPALGINMQVLVPLAAAGGDFCVLHEEKAPGGGPPLHVHDQQTELFLILEGDYELAVGDQRFRAGPGDVAVVPTGAPHTSSNAGTGRGPFVSLLGPALEAQRFLRGLLDLRERADPDPADRPVFANPVRTE